MVSVMVETHGYTLEEIANVFDSKDDLTVVNTLSENEADRDVEAGRGDDKKSQDTQEM